MEKESPDFEMENGMESSRGGPLTTFIMTLPLIVVPTIAMLKPVDSGRGLVSDLIHAASSAVGTESDAFSETDAPPDFAAVEDEFAALFGDSSDSSQDTGGLKSGQMAFHEDNGESLVDDFPGDFDAPPFQPSPPLKQPHAHNAPAIDDDAERLVSELVRLGAFRTLWFSPDSHRVGLAAFFRSGEGNVSYRFGAIAETRSAAARDVVQQATAWKASLSR